MYFSYEQRAVYNSVIGDGPDVIHLKTLKMCVRSKRHQSYLLHVGVFYVTLYSHMYPVYMLGRCDGHSIPYFSCLTYICTVCDVDIN